MLLSRIKAHLGSSAQALKLHLVQPVRQSTIVSSFSGPDTQEATQRQQMLKSTSEAGMALRQKRLVL